MEEMLALGMCPNLLVASFVTPMTSPSNHNSAFDLNLRKKTGAHALT